jgi:hypothetical protein
MRIILKWIFKKFGVTMWTGLNYLRKEGSCQPCRYGDESSGFIRSRDFLNSRVSVSLSEGLPFPESVDAPVLHRDVVLYCFQRSRCSISH